MDLSILIISYNTRDLTLACLRSVFEQQVDAELEVIVFDNASEDGSAEAIETQFPKAKLIRSDRNVGFARANNLAAMQATGGFLLLLNPDTELLPGTLPEAMQFAQNQSAPAIVGGRTYFADGSLNRNSCHNRPTPWSLFCMGLGLSCLFRGSVLFNPESIGRWKRNTVRTVDAITGCFLLMDRSLWMRLGGFDERFFMYGEDTDLCLRARQIGARCVVCPDLQLIHHGGKSERVRADKMVKLFNAKAQLFARWWHPRWVQFGFTMLCLWALTRYVAHSILGLFNPARAQKARSWKEILDRRAEYMPKVPSADCSVAALPA